MEPAVVDLIGPDERIDFPDLMLRAIRAGHQVQTLQHAGYWRDIGNRADYEAAISEFEAAPADFLAPR